MADCLGNLSENTQFGVASNATKKKPSALTFTSVPKRLCKSFFFPNWEMSQMHFLWKSTKLHLNTPLIPQTKCFLFLKQQDYADHSGLQRHTPTAANFCGSLVICTHFRARWSLYLHNTPFIGPKKIPWVHCSHCLCMMNAYYYLSAAILKVVQEDVYPKELVSQKHQAAERHSSHMN